MSVITGLTRGGIPWTPAFIVDLRQATCIGCGRCYKVCPRDVFELVDRDDLDLEEIDALDAAAVVPAAGSVPAPGTG